MTLEIAFKSIMKQLYRFGNLKYQFHFVFTMIEEEYPKLDFARSDLEWLYTKYINELEYKYL